jgi:hypothetical protein
MPWKSGKGTQRLKNKRNFTHFPGQIKNSSVLKSVQECLESGAGSFSLAALIWDAFMCTQIPSHCTLHSNIQWGCLEFQVDDRPLCQKLGFNNKQKQASQHCYSILPSLQVSLSLGGEWPRSTEKLFNQPNTCTHSCMVKSPINQI